jgi:integrase
MSALRKPVLTQRGRLWQAKTYIGRINGKSQYAYVSAETEAEATAAAYAKLREANPAVGLGQSALTLGEWMQQHLQYMQRERKHSTTHRANQIYRAYIEPVLAHKKLRQIAPLDIDLVHARLYKAQLSGSTIRQTHFLLNSAFRRAKRMGLMSTNPCADMDKPKLQEVRKQVLTIENLKALLAAFAGTWWHDHVLLLTHTGLRRGELLGLRRRDVDLIAGTITVGNTLLEIDSEMRVDTPKTAAGFRILALPADVMTMLKTRLETFDALSPDHPLFPNRDGDWQRPSSLSVAIKEQAKRLGLEAWTHLFRHSHASILLRATGDLAQVSKRLGHANTAITARVYSQAMEQVDHNMATVSGKLFA